MIYVGYQLIHGFLYKCFKCTFLKRWSNNFYSDPSFAAFFPGPDTVPKFLSLLRTALNDDHFPRFWCSFLIYICTKSPTQNCTSDIAFDFKILVSFLFATRFWCAWMTFSGTTAWNLHTKGLVSPLTGSWAEHTSLPYMSLDILMACCTSNLPWFIVLSLERPFNRRKISRTTRCSD